MNDTYDAGYLPNDEDCDQDSIRVELAYSHDFYSSIIEIKDEQIAELESQVDFILNKVGFDERGFYLPCGNSKANKEFSLNNINTALKEGK